MNVHEYLVALRDGNDEKVAELRIAIESADPSSRAAFEGEWQALFGASRLDGPALVDSIENSDKLVVHSELPIWRRPAPRSLVAAAAGAIILLVSAYFLVKASIAIQVDSRVDAEMQKTLADIQLSVEAVSSELPGYLIDGFGSGVKPIATVVRKPTPDVPALKLACFWREGREHYGGVNVYKHRGATDYQLIDLKDVQRITIEYRYANANSPDYYIRLKNKEFQESPHIPIKKNNVDRTQWQEFPLDLANDSQLKFFQGADPESSLLANISIVARDFSEHDRDVIIEVRNLRFHRH